MLKEQVLKEIKEINAKLTKIKKDLEQVRDLEGTLWIDSSHGTPHFYLHKEEYKTGRKRTYISKKNIDYVRKLAKKDYLNNAVRVLEEQYRLLKDFYGRYDEKALLKLTTNLHPERRKLIDPLVLSDEEYLDLWTGISYERKPFEEGLAMILTNRGERVRSKSEKIIADKLLKEGIPYRYECPIQLGHTIIYPDFTVLNKRTREEFYLEHFGKMDDQNYCNDALARIELYEKHGFYLGQRLLATFETKKRPLDSRVLDMIVGKYLLWGW